MEDSVTTAEAARTLGVTPQAVSLMVRSGRLVPVKKLAGVRGAFLFDPASIEALKEGAKHDEEQAAS